MDPTKDVVRSFVINNFLFGNGAGLDDEASFLEEGIIDSTGVLELIAFIEETYSISIHDKELIPENLDSIKNVVGFINTKKLQQADA